MEMVECQICYNDAKRHTKCENCNFVLCMVCIEKMAENGLNYYKCQGCDVHWSREDLNSRIPHSLRAKLAHLEALRVLDNEKRLVGQTGKLIQRRKRARKLEHRLSTNVSQIAALNKMNKRLRTQISEARHALVMDDDDALQTVCPCPATGCSGIVHVETSTTSTTASCPLCDTRVCVKCYTAVSNCGEEHQCNPDVLANIAFIESGSGSTAVRPCPKCNRPIMKEAGCNQMWCTICHTAFSWTTMKVTSTISAGHNPHFREWTRELRRTVANNNTNNTNIDVVNNGNGNNNDQPVCADGVESWVRMSDVLSRVGHPQSNNRRFCPISGSIVIAFGRLLLSIAPIIESKWTELQPGGKRCREAELTALRVKMIESGAQCDDQKWVSSIKRVTKRYEKSVHFIGILRTFLHAGWDILEILLFAAEDELRRGILATTTLLSMYSKYLNEDMTFGKQLRPHICCVEKNGEGIVRIHHDGFASLILGLGLSSSTTTPTPTLQQRHVYHPDGIGELAITWGNISRC